MKKVFLVMLAFLLFCGISEATQTRVVVRAKARDAKFIGSAMGGALVVIKDSDTGEVLAKGFTSGGTGNTRRLMVDPLKRGESLADENTAVFETSVDIDEPRLVTIEVHAPYAQRQSMAVNTTQIWLIPGKDITGDGIIVDVYGFSVDVLTPQAHEMVKLAGEKATVQIRANIVMMCGCPVMPGGIWDSNRYEVKALVKHDGAGAETIPLSFAGKPNTFEGTVQINSPGAYEVTVYAYDPATGNTGVDRVAFMVAR